MNDGAFVKRQYVNICGINIDNITMAEVLITIVYLIKTKKCGYIVTPNVDHIVKLQHDPYFKRIYDAAHLVIADGMPLVWASKFLGKPIPYRITGADLSYEICKLSADNGYKLFFLGGNPGVAQKAKENLETELPALSIVGVYSPPFGFENDIEENKKIIYMIMTAKPDILLVCLGAPKQEKWIYKYYRELSVPVSIGAGATLDFMAGSLLRAPLWMQKAGFEWFWRMMMEPRRLWKRYLIDDIKFFWLVLKQKLRENNKHVR